MTDFTQCDNFSMTARVLGALFTLRQRVLKPLRWFQHSSDEWQTQWPLPSELPQLARMFKDGGDDSLTESFQRLFIGPYALPSPPWGSVWLDRENVLFGESTLALRQWMRENSIQFEMQQNEPEDHFGSLLLMAAGLQSRVDTANVNSYWHGICSHGHPVSSGCSLRMPDILLSGFGKTGEFNTGKVANHVINQY